MLARPRRDATHKRFPARSGDGTHSGWARALATGFLYRRSFDLGGYVRPTLRAVVEANQETASFYIRDGSQRVCLYHLNSSRAPSRRRRPPAVEQGAAGRVQLAFTEPGNSSMARIRETGMAVSAASVTPRWRQCRPSPRRAVDLHSDQPVRRGRRTKADRGRSPRRQSAWRRGSLSSEGFAMTGAPMHWIAAGRQRPD